MVTATKRYDVPVPGVRKTYWRNGRVDTALINAGRDYMAQSASVSGDHKKPNPWYFRKARLSEATMNCVQTNPASGYDRESGCYPSLFQNDTDPNQTAMSWQLSHAYNLACNDLGSKLRGDLDLSTNLFQYKQLLASVNRLRAGTKSLQQIRSRLSGGWKPAAKELASLRLEWTYGIKPLLQDIYDTFEKALTEAKSGTTPLHFRGRGSSVEGWTQNGTLTAFSVATCPVKYQGERSVRCQLDIYVKPESNQLQKIAGYTSMNPVSWFYEGIPYSFVVDWLWNFGGYLRALENALLYQTSFVSGCRTDTYRNDASISGGGKSSDHPTITYQVTSGTGTWKMYDRYALTAYPVPERPRVVASMSAWRVVNAVALLLQFLDTTPRKGNRKRGPSKPKRRKYYH